MKLKSYAPLAFESLVLCFAITNPAVAAPIGNLNIANCSGGGVTVTINTIVWAPNGTVANTGCIDTGLGTNVVYSGGTLGPGVAGNIEDLTFGPGSVNNFMTFPAVSPVLDFMLTSVGPGDANTNCHGLALNATCSVFAGSPFVLQNLGPGDTAVSFAVGGTVSDANGPANWHGLFTVQLTQDAGTIQDTILAPGGNIQTTHSASFTVSAVPEPATISILGSGLLLIGFAAFRRRKSDARN
jgi:hypothetical protein